MKWIWKVSVIDEGRFERAKKETPSSIDGEAAVFEGSHGTYHCTLSNCNCQDFQLRLKGQQPCKHILALGIAVGAYNADAIGKRFELLRIRDRLASAYGHYYLFDHPVLSDAEYDTLKEESKRLAAELGVMKVSDAISPDEFLELIETK